MTKKQLVEKLALVDCDHAEVHIYDQESQDHASLVEIEINFPEEGDPYVVLY